MANQGFAVLSLAVFLALFEIGTCLRCYQCNSQQDPVCGDSFQATAAKYLVDCMTSESINYNQGYLRDILPRDLLVHTQGASRYCHKIIMQTGTVVRTCLDGNPTVMNRTCQILESNSKLPQTDGTMRIKYCNVCDKDSCNGASSLSFSFPLATIILIVSYMFCKQ